MGKAPETLADLNLTRKELRELERKQYVEGGVVKPEEDPTEDPQTRPQPTRVPLQTTD